MEKLKFWSAAAALSAAWLAVTAYMLLGTASVRPSLEARQPPAVEMVPAEVAHEETISS